MEDPGRTRAHVRFHEPVAAVAEGQMAVCFDGDRVVGGGRIVATDRRAASVD
jgi:tRNA U34 2-thiouridine synthase MnmA/TrmU